MNDRYVVDWGVDGTGYLRPASFGTAPPSTPDPPPAPSPEEEHANDTDEPWAYGRPAGTPSH